MIFRLRDFAIYPAAIWRFRRLLERAQRWDQDTRRGWIQERLNQTLWQAVHHVPYYRRTLAPYRSCFNDMIDRLDLSELPILTKDEIKANYDALCADNAAKFHPHPVHTSGSTGTPTKFLLDEGADISHFASIWRVLNWGGYRFGDRFADLTGFVLKNDRLFQYDARLNCLHLSSFNFKRENIVAYVDRLNRFRPVLIKAFPSSMNLFCRWLDDLGVTVFRPNCVLSCAETLLDHQRQKMESVLGCPVYDFYNQNERASLISTCEYGTYHVHEEYSFTEWGSESSGPNNTSEIIATTYHNMAMPLVRYKTDDLAELRNGSDKCACGRSYRTVRRIIGRIEDLIVTPDGRHVGSIAPAFSLSPGIRLSQIIQDTTESITIKIVKGDNFHISDVDTLDRGLRSRLGEVISIEYDYVDAILPGRNGKIKFIISKPGQAAVTAH